MRDKVAEFVENINRQSSPDAVFNLFLNALADFGYDRVMYSALANSTHHDTKNTPAIAVNYPGDWVDHYVRSGYVKNDPVRRHCFTTGRPFTWAEIANSPKFDPSHLKIFPEAISAGLHDGVAIPFHGPFGEIMGVGIASSLGGTDAAKVLLTLTQIATNFHIVHSHLTNPVEIRTLDELTDREREILKWCLGGKSTKEIGDIMCLTIKTIEYHLRKVYDKFGVPNRTAAVAKAVMLGAISL